MDKKKKTTGDNRTAMNHIREDLLNAKKMLEDHAAKHPYVNIEQQKKYAEEFEFMEKLRPEWE
ncbi:hypothetical protein [Melioribacter sp. OK-1-Me]